VGSIFHSAAWVNMALPYTALKATNVGGTLSIIRLALDAGAASVHFISSVAAIPTCAPFESWPTLSTPEIEKRDGYGQSKMVSEILLSQAHTKFGLPVQIFRPSAISGHTKTGFSNKLDFSTLLLRAALAVRGAVRDTTLALHWVPVDFVAFSVVFLAIKMPNQAIFNLVSDGPRLRDVFDELETTRRGKLDALTPAHWSEKIEKLITPDNRLLYPLKDTLKGFGWYGQSSLNTENAISITKATFSDYSMEWGAVTKDHISKSVVYLWENNFL